MARKLSVSILIILAIMAAAIGLVQAEGNSPVKTQPRPVDPGKFMTEMMKMSMSDNVNQITVWLPFEFWVRVGMMKTGGNRALAEQMFAAVRPYIVLFVRRKATSADGSKINVTAEQVETSTVLVGADGTEVKCLKELPADVRTIASSMKASLEKKGKMHLLVFRNANEKGKPLVNEAQRGKLTVLLKPVADFPQMKVTYRTPFDAAVAKKQCAKCKDEVSVKWTYCPWCGTKQAPPGQ